MDETAEYIKMTADVVSAYVSNNSVSLADMPNLIRGVHAALRQASDGSGKGNSQSQAPAIAVRRSVTNDFIACLECGKRFKSLKRHLNTHHDLRPPGYREKWGLPFDYPMVAPSYAQERSKLALDMGLGKKRPIRRKRPPRS